MDTSFDAYRDKQCIDRVKQLIEELTDSGRHTKQSLMRYLFDADTEELLTLLQEEGNRNS